jgi:amidophosphoribosyltransferase
MCGIIGVSGNNHVIGDIYNGLIMLQHRGQDAAGIVTYDDRFHSIKDNGLVSQVFQEKHINVLTGNVGLGQVRYRTTGSLDPSAAQPFEIHYPYGISLIHNGNLTNYKELKDKVINKLHRYVNSTSDTELLLNIFAHELSQNDTMDLEPDDIFDAVARTMPQITGGYAIISVIAGNGLLAFRDPYGIRPLIYGSRKDENGKLEYMVASESVALDSLGFDIIDDVQPGQAIFIDKNNKLHVKQCVPMEAKKPCIFEYIYLARPDSMIDDLSVYKSRLRMGEKLARKVKEAKLEIDAVIPIPETSRSMALGLATQLDLPYREGFIKNRYVGRTFIMPGQEERKKSIRQKLNPIKLEFKGKKILLVDDSIVRGNTSKKIIQLAREAGAEKVYIASACPPIIYQDVYGVDIPTQEELVAHNRTVEEIREYIDADALIYQDVDDLVKACSEGSSETNEFHTGYFDFGYPTPEVTKEYLKEVADEAKYRDMNF